MRSIRTLATAIALSVTTAALAHHDGEVVEANGMRASHAHTDAPAATAHGIYVYMTIENLSDAPDRLLGATVPFAQPARFEASVIDSAGNLSITAVSAVNIAPGQTLTLQPGGLRLVFDDVQRRLEPGELFPVTLRFEGAGTLKLIGEVERDEDGHAGDEHEDAADPAS
ncbi:copper chaperone PCu(A)C [Acuticoccus sp.]|uniref:copper chaperone PCu(A)C n=1 Tax=Acuticoccus sp. TaxID=1904378 RepID=UPI003B521AE8